MSRAVDRGRRVVPPPPRPTPPSWGLTLPSRLSSRLVTVQHGAPSFRHLPRDRDRRCGRDPAVPALAGGRCAGGRGRADRLQGHRLCVPARGAVSARDGAGGDPPGARGATVERAPARARTVRDRARGDRFDGGGVAVRRVTGQGRLSGLARVHRRRAVRRGGDRGHAPVARAGPRAARPGGSGGAAGVRRGRRAAGRGAVGAVTPVRLGRAGAADLAADRRATPRHREVRRPADPSLRDVSPAGSPSPAPAPSAKKLVLVVIDALKPSMLERAIASGRAPALARIREQGVYVGDCVAAFPSVTPVCAATITTGVGPDEHLIPSMNWYHRDEGRYIEYGSSFSASRQFGVLRSLTDTVYRMNSEHLSHDVETVFESLDDADVRTAGTTYLIYRGRHEHEVAQESALARIVTSTLFRRTILGPKELFYADLYASRKTGCRGQLGLPGARDQHTGCVGSYLVEHDLFDFMLYSLPDNDAYSHRNGPHAQVTSLAAADRQLERLMHAAGGPEQFFNDYAVIVCSDHSQAPVEERIRLDEAFADFSVAPPSPSRIGPRPPEIAISPAQRSAMLYALDPDLVTETVQ